MKATKKHGGNGQIKKKHTHALPQITLALPHLLLSPRHRFILCFADLVFGQPGVAIGDDVRDAVPQDTSALKHLLLFQRHRFTLCFADLVNGQPRVALGNGVRDAVTSRHRCTLCFVDLVSGQPGVARGNVVRDAVTTGHISPQASASFSSAYISLFALLIW